MLIAKPTKYGAGVTLYGDFWDLRSLHETIHTLCPEGRTHFSEKQQANIYRPGNCVEKLLVEYDPKIGMQYIEWLNTPILLTSDYLSSYIVEVSRRYIFSCQSGIARFHKLPELLQSYHPMLKEIT